MNEQHNEGGQRQPHWLDAYDAVPRDGPAVLLATTDLRDGETPRGGWVDVSEDEMQVWRDVEAAVGAVAVGDGRWEIIDQIDMGPQMLPDQLSLSELCRAGIRAAARRRHPSSFVPRPKLRLVRSPEDSN
jgi:hypothetical protein